MAAMQTMVPLVMLVMCVCWLFFAAVGVCCCFWCCPSGDSREKAPRPRREGPSVRCWACQVGNCRLALH